MSTTGMVGDLCTNQRQRRAYACPHRQRLTRATNVAYRAIDVERLADRRYGEFIGVDFRRTEEFTGCRPAMSNEEKRKKPEAGRLSGCALNAP